MSGAWERCRPERRQGGSRRGPALRRPARSGHVWQGPVIGVVLGRHLLKLDLLADADPDQIVEFLRPTIRSLTKADD